MNIYIPLSFLIVLLCFCWRKKRKDSQLAFIISMAILLLFSAIRYNMGADYFSYLSDYQETRKWGFDAHYETEPLFGWYLGFFPKYTLFIVTNTLLWFGSIYLLCKEKIESRYYWLFFAYILFTEECVIDAWVAMRSALCMVLFIFAIHFVTNGKRLLACAILIASIFVHMSCVVLLPMVLLGEKSKKVFSSPIFLSIIIALCLYTAFSGKGDFYTWLSVFLSENTEDFSKYQQYLEPTYGQIDILRTLLFRLLVIIPFVFMYKGLRKETEKEYVVYYQIGLIACSLTLILGSGMISRFLMILNPYFIISLIRSIKYSEKTFSYIAIFCVLFVSVYSLSHSMDADYNQSMLHYKTIFSAPRIP